MAALTYSQQQLTDVLHTLDPTGATTDIFHMTTAFSQKYIAPHERQMWQDQEFKTELFPLMGDAGLLGVMLPEEYGGMGLGHLQWAVTLSAIAYECASTGLNVLAHSSLCAGQIARHANEEQKEKYLPDLIAGRKIGALAMTEPNAGSDVLGSMRTKARQEDGGWVINGEKTYITNAGIADVYLVYARTGEDSYTTFLVDKETPGFSVGKKIDKIGMRASPTHPLYFDNCFVPDSHVVGIVGKGHHVLMSGLVPERLDLAALCDGPSRGAIDEARAHAQEREQFGKKLYEFEGVSFPAARMRSQYDMFRDNLLLTALRIDQNPKFFDDKLSANDKASSVFYNGSQTIIKITQEGHRITAGMGMTHDYRMGRRHADAQLFHTGGGTENIRLIQISRGMFAD